MDFKELNRDNFMLYAMSNYSNPECMGMGEFTEDLAKIKYVKRLLKKFKRTGKLLLNHLMILGNVFGRTPTARMLFYKLEPDIHPLLKTTLLYLDYIHEGAVLDGIRIETVPMDQRLAQILKGL